MQCPTFMGMTLGFPNLVIVTVSAALLIRYGTSRAVFAVDPSEPNGYYCESTLQVYLSLDAALSACLVLATVVAAAPRRRVRANDASTIVWATVGLLGAKLTAAFTGLAFAFPSGFNHCKAGDPVLWTYAAFRICLLLGVGIGTANHAASKVAGRTALPIAEHVFVAAHGAVHLILFGGIVCFLVLFDTPYTSTADAAASPPPNSPPIPTAVNTGSNSSNSSSLSSFLFCEQSVSSYLYFELATTFSVLTPFALNVMAEVARGAGDDIQPVEMSLDAGFCFSHLVTITSLIFGSKQLLYSPICQKSDPLLYQFALLLFLFRIATALAFAVAYAIFRGLHARRRALAADDERRRANAWHELGALRFMVATASTVPGGDRNTREIISLCTRVFKYEPPKPDSATCIVGVVENGAATFTEEEVARCSEAGAKEPNLCLMVRNSADRLSLDQQHQEENDNGSAGNRLGVNATPDSLRPVLTQPMQDNAPPASRRPSHDAPSMAMSTRTHQSARDAAAAEFMQPSFESTECPVCYVPFERGERLREMLVCRHAFHSRCVETWLRQSATGVDEIRCPLCMSLAIAK
ncbi:hypothetical protein DFJ73DRAFT_868279 [Zopfochytrium polystomum]|nr:hypothetical protein DFJ73DRAFT_868279 [Zopfochytrium polystomum]